MTRQIFDRDELYNLLVNAHGIEVREWIVDSEGTFQGIIFDALLQNKEWAALLKEPIA